MKQAMESNTICVITVLILTLSRITFLKGTSECENAISTSGYEKCVTVLYNFNVSGLLSFEDGCRLYHHSVRCLEDNLNNNSCTTDIVHNVLSNLMINHVGIMYGHFGLCEVNKTENAYCNDSLALLSKGIGLCGGMTAEHNCAFFEEVFLKQCYTSSEPSTYFQCSTEEIRKQLTNEVDWFMDNWGLNISKCSSGDSTKTDICRRSTVLNEISITYCYYLDRYYGINIQMTNEDKCRIYYHFIRCLQSKVFELGNTFKCPLSSLHIWVPDSLYRRGYLFYNYDASVCNVASQIEEFCNDSRALVLASVNTEYAPHYDLFSCRYVKYVMNAFTIWQSTDYLSCSKTQKEEALFAEANWFNSTYSIDVKSCFDKGIDAGNGICNSTFNDRVYIYNQFLNCFSYMIHPYSYNRTNMMQVDGACLVYRYALDCVRKKLATKVHPCNLSSIHEWLIEEILPQSVIYQFFLKCNVTDEDINIGFCDNSLAVYNYVIGFCFYTPSWNVNSPSSICREANKLLQHCYNYRLGHGPYNCDYSNVLSALINQTDMVKNIMNFGIADCFNGCEKTEACCHQWIPYWNCYSSANNTKRCRCDYGCHINNDCCHDVSQTCFCNGNITSYAIGSGCLNIVSNFNNSVMMTYEDGCRQYRHVLQCIERGSGCSMDFITEFTNKYIQTHFSINPSLFAQCNNTGIKDFCNDKRGFFLAMVDHYPIANYSLFTCGALYDLYHVYSRYNWNSAYIRCSTSQRLEALTEQLGLLPKYRTINLNSCQLNSNYIFYMCNGLNVRRSDTYTYFRRCFRDIQTWFNNSGMIDHTAGCQYYRHLLQCTREYYYNNYGHSYVKCGLSSIHNWFKDQVLNGSVVYELVQNCEDIVENNTTYCDDNVAKFVGLFGVSKFVSRERISNMRNSNSSICQELDNVILYYINTYQERYFRCSSTEMASTLDFNYKLLHEHIGDKVMECINVTGTGIPYPIPTASLSPGSIYPYGFQSGDFLLEGDEVMSPRISIPIGFPTVNRFFDFLQIGSNGLISFTVARNFNPPEPIPFNQLAGIDFIAPFWTDIDTRYANSHIYYQAYDRKNILHDNGKTYNILTTATRDVRHFYGISNFHAEWVLIVTWDNVDINGNLEKSEGLSFQCVLVTDGSDSFVMFNYIYMGTKIRQGTKAAMGYRLYNYKQNEFSFHDEAFKIGTLRGNVGIDGFYIYKLSDDRYKKVNYRQLCYQWYNKYSSQTSYIDHLYSSRYNCPCSLRSIRFDWRWMKIKLNQNGVSCYALFASRLLPSTRTCCYNDFYGNYIRITPSAGSFHLHHPIFSPRSFITEESLPKEYCCYRSNLCRLYYALRPIGWCYGRIPFTFRWFWGDPHIETLDGLQYTFNGFGEYQLLGFQNENVTFGLQARTDLIISENGTYSNATIFSAFAAKENNATLQVELTEDRKHIAIFANGYEYTSRFRDEDNFIVFHTDISMFRHNSTLVVIFGATGLQLNVTLGIRMLTFSLTVPNEFQGSTYGLVGNFDGNKDNDFILPNGTMLSNNNTNTEKKIFYNFGVHWAINESTSLFNYSNGTSAEDYSHPEFIPLFIDEFPDEDVQKAKEICGGDQASTACIFDYLLTKDKSVGLSSGQVDKTSTETIKEAANQIPEITGTQTVHAVIGQTVSIFVNGSDDGNFTYKVISGPSNNSLTLITDRNEYQWIPQDMTPVKISITAIDDSGAAAPALDVIVVVCNNCSGHGDCLFDDTRDSNTSYYKYAVCNCSVGWTGDFCSDEVDGCAGFPCSNNRTCTDLSPDEEIALGRGFNCSSCGEGYVENGQKCDDIDECSESNYGCSQNCSNTVGSYYCACMSGYNLVNGSECVDVDECTKKIDGCEQKCENNDGSYKCFCFDGFDLLTDGKSCNKTRDLCDSKGPNCTYACVHDSGTGNYSCTCPAGEILAPDGVTCEDEDECKLNICDQKCNNIVGSFKCSCNDGYYLEANNINCSPCGVGTWGPNCANQCGCGEGTERCDATNGCVCEKGFTGIHCTNDTDECSMEPSVCSENEVCKNIIGSYICLCDNGFTRSGNICEVANASMETTTASSSSIGTSLPTSASTFEQTTSDRPSTSTHITEQDDISTSTSYSTFGQTTEETSVTEPSTQITKQDDASTSNSYSTFGHSTEVTSVNETSTQTTKQDDASSSTSYSTIGPTTEVTSVTETSTQTTKQDDASTSTSYSTFGPTTEVTSVTETSTQTTKQDDTSTSTSYSTFGHTKEKTSVTETSTQVTKQDDASISASYITSQNPADSVSTNVPKSTTASTTSDPTTLAPDYTIAAAIIGTSTSMVILIFLVILLVIILYLRQKGKKRQNNNSVQSRPNHIKRYTNDWLFYRGGKWMYMSDFEDERSTPTTSRSNLWQDMRSSGNMMRLNIPRHTAKQYKEN